MGSLLHDQGAYAEARVYYEQALTMSEALHPKRRYPRGHLNLAVSLNNVGALLLDQGAYGEARGYLERALEMRQALYPKEQYPRGHIELAVSLNNLAVLLSEQGAYGEARGYSERSLAMRQALYPKEQYPQGHAELARSLMSLSILLHDQGAYGEARSFYERALAMNQALYPKEQYPHGHPDLARSLGDLASALQDQGAYGEARGYHERALVMYQVLYPKERYPQGHPDLAMSLNVLGVVLKDQGAYGEAKPLVQQGVDMQQGLADVLLAATSEAEALNYLGKLPLTRDAFISVCLHVPKSDEANYAQVWRCKAAVARVLQRRQAELLSQAAADPAARRRIESWRNFRGQLSRLALSTADGRDHPDRLAKLQQLTADKESLERQLAEAIPEFGRRRALERSPHTKLVEVLPEHTAVLDLVRHAASILTRR